jgi:hypothetical protein
MLFANNMIACTPPTVAGVKAEVKHGFAVGSNQHTLCELKVIFNSKYQDSVLDTGSSVFVSMESASGDAWAKRVYTHSGTQFVLVPAGHVIAHIQHISGFPVVGD